MITRLKNIAQVKAGNSAPNKDTFSASGIPFIRAGSLEFLVRNESIDNCEKIGETEAKSLNLNLFPKGSILFAKSGMSAKMGRFYQLPSDAFVVSHLAVIIPEETKVSSSYLKYYFIGKPPIHLIRDEAYPSIRLSDIGEVELDLPDLDTQNKIVAILDKASELVQKRLESVKLLDDLLHAQFYFSFGEPYQNPLQWPTKLLDEITLNIKSGWSIGGDQRQKDEDELGVLKVSAVTSGIFKPEEHKAVQKENITKELVTPKKGDLLFSRANTIELVGATCIVDKNYDDLFLPDKLWRIDVDESIVTKEYVKAVLTSPIYRKNFVRTATGSSGSMLNISQAKFKAAQIPIPTIESQRKYSELFWKIQKQKDILLRSLKEINVLHSSILQSAFSGNLDFDVKTELDVLLKEIDLQKPENDLYSIVSNEEYVNSLVERLNTQAFENQDLYDKAKHAAFQLLRTDEILTQKYDETSKSLKLEVK